MPLYETTTQTNKTKDESKQMKAPKYTRLDKLEKRSNQQDQALRWLVRETKDLDALIQSALTQLDTLDKALKSLLPPTTTTTTSESTTEPDSTTTIDSTPTHNID